MHSLEPFMAACCVLLKSLSHTIHSFSKVFAHITACTEHTYCCRWQTCMWAEVACAQPCKATPYLLQQGMSCIHIHQAYKQCLHTSLHALSTVSLSCIWQTCKLAGAACAQRYGRFEGQAYLQLSLLPAVGRVGTQTSHIST